MLIVDDCILFSQVDKTARADRPESTQEGGGIAAALADALSKRNQQIHAYRKLHYFNINNRI